MLRRILVIALLVGLSACGGMRSPVALLLPHRHHHPTAEAAATTPAPPAPKPAEGLWAILDPGCPKPNAANIHAWPKCASPFWISRDKALVVRSATGKTRSLIDASFAADYSLAPGNPMIAQVGTEKDGYLFLALTDLSEDDQGRLIGAVGAAVACPKPSGGGLAIKPNLNGCETESLDTVRKAAAETLQDRSTLTEVAWIAPGAPSGAP
ncbi:MAG: hypothetical protein ACHP7N_06375 [Caulobacterales bacterium]